MPALKLRVEVEKLRLSAPFRISGFVFEEQEVVLATLADGGHRGRGEASGVYYLGDTAQTMIAAIEAARADIEAGADRGSLQRLLPPGGARNAIDCALWELDAHRLGVPVWKLAGLPPPKPLLTTFTLGADEPSAMAEGARKYAQAKALKLKLTGDLPLDIERVRAVRAARPEVWMGVDANQGYTIDALESLVAALQPLNISLLEQPLKRGREADLDGFKSKIPIAADESALSMGDIPGLVGRFQVLNIKLDKCGGLTEGLAMAHEARRLGLRVMVGNMVGTSLAMAPGFVLGQLCDVVDLDGPIFLAQDRTPSMTYTDGNAWSGEHVWGGPSA
ncbi:MAG: enolase superfamily enzyme related to L-alanine-DL-glutamate epimerase [Gammaproteobacteria bacterium]|nr:enolase superfamily enzyme related to L-alanine-DL-glutamate epimerase [Gammaproteobacteria bacterium]